MLTTKETRPWFWDALTALAYFLLAGFLGKLAARALTPIGGLFVVIICGGLGWLYARTAWQNFRKSRPK